MKKNFIFFVILTTIFFYANVYATSFTLINSDFHISGSLIGFQDEDSTYDIQSSHPISGGIITQGSYPAIMSAATENGISANLGVLQPIDYAEATAESIITFKPNFVGEFDPLMFEIGFYSWDGSGWFTPHQGIIVDLTTDEIIFQVGGFELAPYDHPPIDVLAYPGWVIPPDAWGNGGGGLNYRNVTYYSGWDPNHLYSMTISGGLSSYGFAYTDMYISHNMSFVPVPEPATMLLLGSGLIGLVGFRKRFRKK